MVETTAETTAQPGSDPDDYEVTEQIGHLLRRAHQRASALFQETLDDPALTPTQFAALMKLADGGPLSQNHLGRLTAMDPATIQGVIRRLGERGLIERRDDPTDRRRTLLMPSEAGRALAARLVPSAREVTRRTLEPLTQAERRTLIDLLIRIGG
ncbi:winged helix-turn-helix transcriptional regulator [Marivibrio halodurans]|uniref:Winged helix-turn-helix transcriptional regulator n=1 Tax=Marivibrio halodurans TaxID=2039722 RepID=A0A8J7SK94_9PROT|nr:MarR family winged helix-turn-helix transcriptional regulator [Marivibrio halodurans]MBP5858308.1 winged helix-turn-helix transcriptional regulator [Marivibrio halodurans]